MVKSIVVFAFLIAAVYSFAAEQDEDLFSQDAEVEVVPEEARRSLPPGSKCDGSAPQPHCQCYGKWHRCDCDGARCHCKPGTKHTCIQKLKCPNKREWGPYWRSEETGRSPC
uniref:Putative neurotoxin LTDF 14-06 n=1 Tax=Dolomedes fimbriatus TaxID=1432569 RepID=A0A0K1D8F7_9ARAC|nr:putative neurotoxin LTDF 14-06 [Dolomedes fimbriatus]